MSKVSVHATATADSYPGWVIRLQASGGGDVRLGLAVGEKEADLIIAAMQEAIDNKTRFGKRIVAFAKRAGIMKGA